MSNDIKPFKEEFEKAVVEVNMWPEWKKILFKRAEDADRWFEEVSGNRVERY